LYSGWLAADLTRRKWHVRSGDRFHLVNNALAFLIYGEAGALISGLTLFLFPYEMPAKFLISANRPPDSPPFDPGALISPDFLFELVGVGIFWQARVSRCGADCILPPEGLTRPLKCPDGHTTPD